MKKVLLTLSLMIVLAFSGKAQYSGLYGLVDNTPNTGGLLYWQSSNDGLTFRNQYILAFDSNYMYMMPFRKVYPSNNTNTRLLAVNDSGRIEPFDILSIPSKVGTLTAMSTKSLNVAYQASTTSDSKIYVSAKVSCNLSLLAGQSGSIILEVSPNGTTGWVYVGQIDGSNTGTLTVGLNTVQITGGQLTAPVKKNSYWRLRTVNNTGTPTFTWNGGSQE
jgi:hypothetical protein